MPPLAPIAAADAPARTVLREVFGYPEFRAGQGEAVAALVSGQDAVVVLPTGAGKSLCYQVPAIVASRAGRGMTVVVSPLIALMDDQVGALRARGVAAAAIHSHQDEGDRRDVLGAVSRGKLDLVYVSPERAALPGFRRLLQRAPVAHLAIDEAHCISEWGHDFRPEYMRLGELREVVCAPTIALTATATPQVTREIATRLQLREPALVRGSFRRPNLSFAVAHHRSDAARVAALTEELEAAGLRGRGAATGRAIVYCSTRAKTEAFAKALRSAGVAVGYYHAGRTKLARERAQRAFETGRTRVLVATNAFGMGIDHPDVRLLVHAQAPGSLEAYYQEAGRAGRDGLPARCVLFFGPGDLVTQRRLRGGQSAGAALEDRAEAALAAVETYATGLRCRQQVLCAHFTEADDDPPCGICDVCEDPDAVADAHAADAPAAPPREVTPLGSDARERIIEAAANLRRPVGKTNLARALRGSRAKPLRRLGLLDLPEHGCLRRHDEASIVAAIEALLESGALARRGQKYPTVWLPGRPVRAKPADDSKAAAAPRRPRRPRTSDLTRALETYRRRIARNLDWKPYMVYQRKVIAAIDARRPRSAAELARIPGLGPAKLERFGDDLLDLVRRHGD